MQILEEINTFQTQLDDLAKGVNRIRYLKQKINNSLGSLKPIQSFTDNSSSPKHFNATTTRLQTQSGNRKKQLFTLESDRFQTDQSKDSKVIHFSDTHRNFYKESKNGTFRQKWNDSFMFPAQPKKVNQTFRHENPTKLETFYSKSLMKNVDCSKNDEISLQELKKINYAEVKKLRKQFKKENRTKEVLMKKQKVLMGQRMAKKRNQGFILQKLSDLRTRKLVDKEQKAKLITAKLQNQMELENKEAERLKNLQKAVLIKFNMRKLIEQKLSHLNGPAIVQQKNQSEVNLRQQQTSEQNFPEEESECEMEAESEKETFQERKPKIQRNQDFPEVVEFSDTQN